jgi:hypothetical protein
MRLADEYAAPNFGIATHVCPATNGAWHREHSYPLFFTGTRSGLPFVPPINDGTGPLGLLFIFPLRFQDSSDDGLEYII